MSVVGTHSNVYPTHSNEYLTHSNEYRTHSNEYPQDMFMQSTVENYPIIFTIYLIWFSGVWRKLYLQFQVHKRDLCLQLRLYKSKTTFAAAGLYNQYMNNVTSDDNHEVIYTSWFADRVNIKPGQPMHVYVVKTGTSGWHFTWVCYGNLPGASCNGNQPSIKTAWQ